MVITDGYIKHKRLETDGLIRTASDHIKTENSKFKLKDVTKLNRHYWVLLTGFILWCASSQASLNISVSYYHHMFGFSYNLASTLGFIGAITRYMISSILYILCF